MRKLLCITALAALVVGCAGTQVFQKSLSWEVNEATGKVYMSSKEVTKGTAGALAAKLDTGAMTTYVQVDADGSYVVDLSGQAAGVDAVALSQTVVDLAKEFSKMLPEGQLVGFVSALKSGMSTDEIVDKVREALMTNEAVEPLVEDTE